MNKAKLIKRKIREMTPFMIASKAQYLGINLTEKVKVLYIKNNNILKKIKNNNRKRKDIP